MPETETDVSKICFTANLAWNLTNFRLNHMKAVQSLGIEVHAVAPYDDCVAILEREGITYHEWRINRRSLNPFNEIGSIGSLLGIYRRVQPCLVHHYTVKAILYGTISARLCGIPAIVNAVTGMPYIIVSPKQSLRGSLARNLSMRWYLWSLAGSDTHAVFQNLDDVKLVDSFSRKCLENRSVTRGSGVDLQHFSFQAPIQSRCPIVLFIGRIIREKGFLELIEAIRILRATGREFRFKVCGSIDSGNRSSIGIQQVERWLEEGLIDRLVKLDDVRPALAEAEVVVLPSYREGTPRSLLEALAVGRPVVATDVPGCREVVRCGINGVLVEPKDSESLANGIASVLALDAASRGRMGLAGRRMAEQLFDEKGVIQANLAVYKALAAGSIPEVAGRTV